MPFASRVLLHYNRCFAECQVYLRVPNFGSQSEA